ncbi:MAG: adenylate/guanylate cyclase domain-containing protein [Geminicoccaceae bacterium]
MAERLQRRLAAILAADVVGYSRLMAADERGTLARLRSLRQEAIDPAIAAHGGRIVKLMGDGMLVEFASAVDAVTCAAELQALAAARNDGQPAERAIRFRIGINLGDIIVEGDDLFGDGVNVAARIEGIAAPGEVWMSRAVAEQVRDKLELALESLGDQALKNIPRPVEVFRIATGEAAPAPAAPAAPRRRRSRRSPCSPSTT